jgi:hypothetical protein
MAPPPVEARVDNLWVVKIVGIEERSDRFGVNKRNIAGKEKEAVYVGFKAFNPCQDGAKHPLVVIRVEDPADAQTVQDRLEFIGPVPQDYPHVRNPCLERSRGGLLQQGGSSKERHGLEGPHPGGVAGGNDQRNDPRGLSHQIVPDLA